MIGKLNLLLLLKLDIQSEYKGSAGWIRPAIYSQPKPAEGADVRAVSGIVGPGNQVLCRHIQLYALELYFL
jgi:hypothetical protein